MKNTIPKNVRLELQILGYYQIAGGSIGILSLVWAVLQSESIPNSTILLWIIISIFFLYSLICGLLCLEFKNSALRCSLVNQCLQVIGLYLAGFAFFYVAGLHVSFIIPITNSSESTFELGISRFDVSINKAIAAQKVEINLFAIGVIAWLINVMRKIEGIREEKEFMQLGEKVSLSNSPLEVKIVNRGEIRMGSPYNTCEIELVGFHKIQLPKNGWQDKYAWSPDSKNLVLVKWDFEKNEPGFRFFVIDTEAGLLRESEKIFGLVNRIAIEGNTIKYNKFLLDKQKSRAGSLCCDTDEEYNF